MHPRLNEPADITSPSHSYGDATPSPFSRKGGSEGDATPSPPPSRGEIQRGARSGCLAKGRVNGRGFGRCRTLVAEGHGYGTRMCKTTRWAATALKLKVAARAHGLATWAVTGSGKLVVQHLAQRGNA